jgi:hypothetical protein
MKGYLSKEQIDYVLFHLAFTFEITDDIRKRFVFISETDTIHNYSGKIIFLLSESSYDKAQVIWHSRIPILFPVKKSPEIFDLNGNLIFNVDLLKSAFYLLSGYHEYSHKERDAIGRFPFEYSIQKELGIIQIPVVNYYFTEISKGIELFCKREKIVFTEKQFFNTFGFFLTHDVDRVDAYTVKSLFFRLKELAGMVKSNYGFYLRLELMFRNLLELLKFDRKQNPFWNFEWLRSVEEKLGFVSVFFFLTKEIRNKDAIYNIDEKRFYKLIKWLDEQKCEVGVHATLNSSFSLESMKKCVKKVRSIHAKATGCRQHNLKIIIPDTIQIQQACGLVYDSSLSFSEHEGFRNSYCYPFKLFNFKDNSTIEHWEFPLNVMDSTLFYNRKLSIVEASEAIYRIIEEVAKFHGMFTLLWHNHFFDEKLYPGITKLYTGLLDKIHSKKPVNMTFINFLDYLVNK